MIYESSELVRDPAVSIVVCAFNRVDTLIEALEAILNQKCNFNYEILIGEDKGTDDVKEVCLSYFKKYPDKIKIIFNENNLGLGNNWYNLVNESKGKYIASCDDDDFWFNNSKLQKQYDFLEANQEFGLIHSEIDILDMTKNKRIKNFYASKNSKIPEGNVINNIFDGSLRICVSTAFFSKKIFTTHFPVKEISSLNPNIQDWPTWMILSKFTKFAYLPESTTIYRIGHEAISNISDFKSKLIKVENDQLLYEFICNYLKDDLILDIKGYENYKNNILLSFAFKKRDFKNAKKYGQLLISNGIKSKKILASKNLFLFNLFIYLKKN